MHADALIDRPTDSLTVREAARLVGLSAHTLRYYEKEGLVHPGRSASGHRVYSDADVRRLVFLTRMRLSGMTIAELRRYVGLVERGASSEAERRAIMLARRERILEQIRQLSLALEATEFKLASYGGHPGDADVEAMTAREGR